MKIIIYNLINELTDETYIEILHTISSFKVNEIKEPDLVFYPLNIEAIREEKRFLLSANKIAYSYLKDLDYLIERILIEYNISISKEEIEIDNFYEYRLKDFIIYSGEKIDSLENINKKNEKRYNES